MSMLDQWESPRRIEIFVSHKLWRHLFHDTCKIQKAEPYNK